MKISIALLGLAALAAACASPENKEFPKSLRLSVANPMGEGRANAMVFLPTSDIIGKASDFNPKAFIMLDGDREISSQYNGHELESTGVVFVIDALGPNESREFTLRYNPEGSSARQYPKLTQAELSHKVNGAWKEREYIGGEFMNVSILKVPPQHKDHSWFIRYEGPGWESDKVGYRFYLDQRNAIDVFGKTVSEPVLQKVGLDGFDSYHEMQEWGMDVMKVGKTLGLGSLGMLVNGAAVRVEKTDSLRSQILENGAVYSSILTDYFGWKTAVDTLTLSAELAIHSGTRVSRQAFKFTGDSDQLCTGLVKDEKAALFRTDPTATSFGYVATFGQQSLNNDNLGLAVLFAQSNFKEFTEDELSHIVRLNSIDGKLVYYFLAAWEKETGGIKTQDEFLGYVAKVAKELAQPVEVSIR